MSTAFDKAAELSRNDTSGKVSTSDKLKGYGFYKCVTAGVGAHVLFMGPFQGTHL